MTLQATLDARLDEHHLSVYRAMPTDLLEFRDIPESRRAVAELRAKMEQPPIPEGLDIEDRLIERAGEPALRVRLYRPARRETPSAALYWIHGGGMILGDLDMDDGWCAAAADGLGLLVVSVEYRLAPEHPYPAPVEDCYAGLRWVWQSADELGVDPGRIAVGGASAGGGLAAGTVLLARDRGEVPVAFQLLVYPMLDDRNAAEASPAAADPKVWNRHANAVGWNAFLAGRAGADDIPPYAAPARATDLAGLPPTYLNVGDLDLFLEEDMAYAQRLMAAGVPVELHVYPGAFHGSNNFVSRSELSKRWRRDEFDALGRALRG